MTTATTLPATKTQKLELEKQLSMKSKSKKPARRTDKSSKKDEGQYKNQSAIVNNKVVPMHSQVNIGERPNGCGHKVDLLLGGEIINIARRKTPDSLHKGGTLIALKFQKTNGTKEICIEGEAIDLQYAIDTYGYDKAVIVMAGTDRDSKTKTQGWTRRQMHLDPNSYPREKLLQICPDVEFMDEETFKQTFSICLQNL